MDLANLLSNRRWARRERPFAHFHATQVFVRSVYEEMTAAFRELLARGLGDEGDDARFTRAIAGYDVYALPLQRSLPRPFHVFMSRAWHDLMATVTGVDATGDVDGSLHHHLAGSAGGRPHNDLNPGWFLDAPAKSDDVNLSDARYCSYRTGALGERPAHESVRAAALLFYLDNEGWREGDGGETGLYTSAHHATEAPAAAIPPLGNSALLFECSPWSYHAFIRNRARPRSSLVMWIHRSKAEAAERWGHSAIVPWSAEHVYNERAR